MEFISSGICSVSAANIINMKGKVDTHNTCNFKYSHLLSCVKQFSWSSRMASFARVRANARRSSTHSCLGHKKRIFSEICFLSNKLYIRVWMSYRLTVSPLCSQTHYIRYTRGKAPAALYLQYKRIINLDSAGVKKREKRIEKKGRG